MKDKFIILGDLGLKSPNGKPILFYWPGKPVDERKMDRKGILIHRQLIELASSQDHITESENEYELRGNP